MRDHVPRFVKWLIGLTACVAMVVIATAARADIPPPEPLTYWAKNQAPDKMHVMIAGICISAAIVAGGLIVAWQVGLKSRAGKTGLTMFAVMLLGAALVTVALPLKIQWENDQWQEWDRLDSPRRSRGSRWQEWEKEPPREQPESIRTSGNEPTNVLKEPVKNDEVRPLAP